MRNRVETNETRSHRLRSKSPNHIKAAMNNGLDIVAICDINPVNMADKETLLMNETEIIEHEAIKNLLKLAVMNNSNFDIRQKQHICERIDIAAKQADWIVEMKRMCGYTP